MKRKTCNFVNNVESSLLILIYKDIKWATSNSHTRWRGLVSDIDFDTLSLSPRKPFDYLLFFNCELLSSSGNIVQLIQGCVEENGAHIVVHYVHATPNHLSYVKIMVSTNLLMVGSISSFFTFKINHGGSFTTTVFGRSYIDELVDHFDFVDMDVFSVHELDDMMAVLGYNDGSIMFYHFMILETDLDSGLLPLGIDQEFIQLARYVPNHKEINLYIEHGKTRVVPYFKSPLKVCIEEVEGNHYTEMNGVRMKRKSFGSCSKKLDLNEPTDLSKFIVPYELMINKKKHSADRERVPLGGTV
ncbi:unnamed protein product [Lactuca saligna]|uniref:PB1-like domain-containing protein n=1 Tax=Lactuca saligna TaxID=75948 RepID=A0AA35ZL45_LACSI|nr:unnamed protein product [Lactuca saligna]